MTLVCYLFSALARVHMIVKIHNVLYILYTSIESPRSVVEKRGSLWMSPTLGNPCALRCWFLLQVCSKEAAMFSSLGPMTWTPFLASSAGPENKTQVRDACVSLLLSRRTIVISIEDCELTQSH
jgi:hypothetical protein